MSERFPHSNGFVLVGDDDGGSGDDEHSAPGGTGEILEIHVPLTPVAEHSDAGYPYAWIETVQEHLARLTGLTQEYDDGEEWENLDGQPEYLFFVYGGEQQQLVQMAAEVAVLPGVPSGVYVTLNDEHGDMGEGRRIPLTED